MTEPEADIVPPDAAAALATGWHRLEADGFIDLIGPFWHRTSGVQELLGFHATDKHMNRSGAVHGGMLASLADRAMGMSARRGHPERRHATVQLNINYLAIAHHGEFIAAHCTLRRETRHMSFVSADIYSNETLVATAQSVWKILSTLPD